MFLAFGDGNNLTMVKDYILVARMGNFQSVGF